MDTKRRYAPEVREREVRLDLDPQGEYDSQWAVIVAISSTIGCTAETFAQMGLASRARSRVSVVVWLAPILFT